MEHQAESVGGRLQLIQKKYNLSSRKMALAIGVDPSQFLKIEKGKLGLTADQAKEISSTWNISIDWLYNGEGEMFKEEPKTQEPILPYKINPRSPFRDAVDLGAWNEDDPTEEHRGKEFIDLGNGKYLLYTPLITHTASMGYLHGYSDPAWLEELPKHAITVDRIPFGTYRTFIGRGLSMFDGTDRSIHPNSKITGRVIRQDLYRDSKLHLHKFQLFVIVHKEGITIKEIIEHNVGKGTILIHSWNPDKNEYPDQELELKDVLQLLNVIKIERDL